MSVSPIHSQEEAHFCSSAMLHICRKNKSFKSPFIPELTSHQRQHPLRLCEGKRSLRGLGFFLQDQSFPCSTVPLKIPSAVTVDQWTIPCFREPRCRVPPEDTETILRHQGPGSSPDLCNHFDLVPVPRECKHVVLGFVNSGHWDLQEKWRTMEQMAAWNPQQTLIILIVIDKEVKCCPWPAKKRKKERGLEEEREGRKEKGEPSVDGER